jgi:hypothetical protein
MFHKQCIDNWLTANHGLVLSCPICRATINNNQVTTIRRTPSPYPRHRQHSRHGQIIPYRSRPVLDPHRISERNSNVPLIISQRFNTLINSIRTYEERLVDINHRIADISLQNEESLRSLINDENLRQMRNMGLHTRSGRVDVGDILRSRELTNGQYLRYTQNGRQRQQERQDQRHSVDAQRSSMANDRQTRDQGLFDRNTPVRRYHNSADGIGRPDLRQDTNEYL